MPWYWTERKTSDMKEFFALIAIGTDHSWIESFEVGGKTVAPLR